MAYLISARGIGYADSAYVLFRPAGTRPFSSGTELAGREEMPRARRLPVPVARVTVVDRKIHLIRDQRVLLDADLAALYDVDTKVLVQAVKRNAPRFPSDFMFRLTVTEFAALRSQFVTSNERGGRRHRPYAFTEHGVAMLSSVLRSRRAIHVNIAIMRAFVRLREAVLHHEALAGKIASLERKYDGQLAVVFEAIRELMAPPLSPPRRRIGFGKPEEPRSTSNTR